MNKLNKLLEKILNRDILNILISIALIVSLIFIFSNPNNQIALLTACVAGGLMNISNGLKIMKDPKRKTMGMSYLMLGIILIGLGFYITNLNQ